MKSLGVCIVAVFMSVGAATLAQTPAYCVSLSEAMEKSPQVAEAQRRLREEFRLENAELTALREKLAEWPDPSRCSESLVRLGGLLCGVHAATL